MKEMKKLVTPATGSTSLPVLVVFLLGIIVPLVLPTSVREALGTHILVVVSMIVCGTEQYYYWKQRYSDMPHELKGLRKSIVAHNLALVAIATLFFFAGFIAN